MIARATLALLLLGSLHALAGEDCRRIEQDFDAAGLERLRLDAHIGEVRIHASEESRVHVDLTVCARGGWSWRRKSVDEAELESDRDGGELGLSLNHDRFQETWDIAMPPGLALDADVGIGDVRISGLSNDIDLDLGIGDVEIEVSAADYGHVSGDVGIGDIRVSYADGDGEASRRLMSAEAEWRSEGPGRIKTDVGIGDAGITLN